MKFIELKDVSIYGVQDCSAKNLGGVVLVLDEIRGFVRKENDAEHTARTDRKKYMRMMECVALKYSRLLYEAGIAYTEEDVWSAYNGGYACGMEQGAEAERSRQG